MLKLSLDYACEHFASSIAETSVQQTAGLNGVCFGSTVVHIQTCSPGTSPRIMKRKMWSKKVKELLS